MRNLGIQVESNYFIGVFWPNTGFSSNSCLWTIGALLSRTFGVIPEHLSGVNVNSTSSRSATLFATIGDEFYCKGCGTFMSRTRFEESTCSYRHSGTALSLEEFLPTKQCRKLGLVEKTQSLIELYSYKSAMYAPRIYTCCVDRGLWTQSACTPVAHQVWKPGETISWPVRYLVGMAGAVEGLWCLEELPRVGWDKKDPATHPMEQFIADLVATGKYELKKPDLMRSDEGFDLFG